MSDEPKTDHGTGDRHGSARHLAETALAAEAAGDADRADTLMAQAEKTDPGAVIDVVEERSGTAVPGDTSDAELAAISQTVTPGSAAPSRAGITGTGSGADDQGL